MTVALVRLGAALLLQNGVAMIRAVAWMFAATVAVVSAEQRWLDEERFFLKHGWAQVSGLLPVLRDSSMNTAIEKQVGRAKLKWARYAHGYLERRHRIKCKARNNQAVCGMPPVGFLGGGFLNPTHTDETLDALSRDSIQWLECCLEQSVNRGEGRKSPNPHESWAKSESSLASLPYYQALNLHRSESAAEDAEAAIILEAALSPELGAIASQFMQADRVRLYQTAYFAKEGSEAEHSQNLGTDWHRDLSLIPLDVGPEGYVTFWCPVGRGLNRHNGDSLLQFAAGSHKDVSLFHWFPSAGVQNKQWKMILEDRYTQEAKSEGHRSRRGKEFAGAHTMEVGDCTAHHGWTWHRADAQGYVHSRKGNGFRYTPPRAAVTFSYVTDAARVLPDIFGNTTRNYRPFTPEDEMSFLPWLRDLVPHGPIEHPMLPLAWPQQVDDNCDEQAEGNLEDTDDKWVDYSDFDDEDL